MEIFTPVESDTSIESIQKAFDRIEVIDEKNIEKERYRLLKSLCKTESEGST